MQKEKFKVWLTTNRQLTGRTIDSRIANCRTVEKYEGDLDLHFDEDRMRDLLERLSYSTKDQRGKGSTRHKIPIKGDVRNGSATLRSAVLLYNKFREDSIKLKKTQSVASKSGEGPKFVTFALVREISELDKLEDKITAAATRTVERLLKTLKASEPIRAFAQMKFEPSGFHPTEDRSLNLIEQLNQTFTYFASARAARWLFDHHPEAAPFRLNLGTVGGTDIESVDGSVAAETFATVNPQNNRKLASDIEKVARTNARHKYVFYICPKHASADPISSKLGAVQVVSLGWNVER